MNKRENQHSNSPNNSKTSSNSKRREGESNGNSACDCIIDFLESFKILSSNSKQSPSHKRSKILENSKIFNQIKKEFIEYGIPKTLLIELKNIKNTLKISAAEIERVFEYPLSTLKDDNGTQVHFNMEKMQLEEFSDILLKDDFISNLIQQIRIINAQLKINEITELLNQFSDEEIAHQNEKTRFDEFINNKFKLDEIFSAKAFTMTSASSVESVCDRNEVSNAIEDIDELVKYINEDTENKKTKKNKNKKNKKNPKNTSQSSKTEALKPNECISIKNDYEKQENEPKEEKKENNTSNAKKTTVKEVDEFIESFKMELEEMSVPSYMTQKIVPTISEEYLKQLKKEYLSK